MSAVRDVLPNIREFIARYRDMGITETDTRSSLINPMLNALGWRVGNLEQVRQEYRFQPSENPVDYALMEGGEPSLFVEAKALGRNLGDHKWASQIMGYAIVAGVEWVVLTDGNEYRIYNTHAPVPVAEKLFHSVRVTDEDASVGEILDLLSRGGQPKDRLKAQWHAHFVDRQIHMALKRLFGPEPDESFVSLLKGVTADLRDEDVAASLRRVRAQFEFPLVHGSAPVVPEAPANVPRLQATTSKARTARLGDVPANVPQLQVTTSPKSVLPSLIRAGIIQPPLDLHRTYLGQALSARIETDGSVTFQGKSFRSLSAASQAAQIAASVTRKSPSSNGWTFWKFTDADGQVKSIDVLRQQYLAGSESDAS